MKLNWRRIFFIPVILISGGLVFFVFKTYFTYKIPIIDDPIRFFEEFEPTNHEAIELNIWRPGLYDYEYHSSVFPYLTLQIPRTIHKRCSKANGASSRLDSHMLLDPLWKVFWIQVAASCSMGVEYGYTAYGPYRLASLTDLQIATQTYNCNDYNNIIYYSRIEEVLHKTEKVCGLYLFGQDLVEVPPDVFKFQNMTYLDLGINEIKEVSPQIGTLTKLLFLDLGSNDIRYIPSEISNLTSLEVLDLRYNLLTELPSEISNLHNLRTLYLKGNDFSNAEKIRIQQLVPNAEIKF